MTGRRALWPLAVAATMVLASAGAIFSPGRPGGRAEGLPDRLPFDPAAVRDRVQYAFRPSGGALRGGAATYDVSLQRGELEVRPRHHPGGRPSGAARGASVTPDGLARARPTPGAPEVIEGAAVRFSPARIGRGGAVLADGAGAPAVAGPAEIEIAKGPVVERLSSRPEGLEQSWRFAARPVGRGALEIRVPVAAGTLVGETERGLHLAAGPLGLRYGHGTWIDARGTATPVRARWDRGAIVLSVPDDVLERSVFPAVLDPVLAPELQLDEPVLGPASGETTPAVAWGGTSYLVVWADRRSGTSQDIYGGRVSAVDGSVLDATPLAISTAAGRQSNPAVAWDGTNYLVVWEDLLTSSSYIVGARVSGADGTVLDGTALAISTAAGTLADPAVAWNGTSYLVVWSELSAAGTDIHGARVRADGSVLDGTALAISTAVGNQRKPAVASDGTDSLVVWEDDQGVASYDVRGARVRSTDGAVLDPDGFAVSAAAGDQREPAVAWSGTRYLVAWTDGRSGSADIYGARVRATDGAVLDVDGLAISTAAGGQSEPVVAWGGTHYLVAWSDQRNGAADLYGARVSDTDGAVLDAAGLAISTAASGQRVPAVAGDGTHFLVVWENRDFLFPGSLGTISAARVRGADAAVLDVPATAPSTGLNSETRAAVATDGTDYLVVWQDDRGGTSSDIYGARVSGADGTVLDGTALSISSAAGDQVRPAVAWDGTHYLVAWEDGRSGLGSSIHGARVRGTDGSVLDPEGLAIATGSNSPQSPAVACDGTNCLVVWTVFPSTFSDGIDGARVRVADGAVLDGSGFEISTRGGAHRDPAVAWDGTNYLVVWARYSASRLGTAILGTSDIGGRRVSGADGSRLDSVDTFITAAPGDQVEPAVSSDGTNHLVVWRSIESGGSDIQGARVRGTDGAVLDQRFPICAAPGDRRDPSVAWDGTGYLVTWTDARAGSEVHARRVRGSGVVPFPDGFPVSAPGRAASRPGVAAAAPGRALVVHEGLVPRPVAPLVRAFARGVTLGPPPVAAPQAATTAAGTPVAITLTATAADGAPLTFVVTTPPLHGALTGTGAERTYTPAAGYDGPDQFAFVASDGPNDSEPATVGLTVTPPPVTPPPVTPPADLPTASGCGCATSGGTIGLLLPALGLLLARRRRPTGGPATRP